MTYILSSEDRRKLEGALELGRAYTEAMGALRAEADLAAALSLLAGLAKVPDAKPNTVYVPCKLHEHLPYTFTAHVQASIPVCPHCAAMKEHPQP